MSGPNYIRWTGHGTACGEPPGVFTGAVMHIFGVRVDQGATQNLVDALLNALPVDGPQYATLGNMALITFVDIARCTTPTEVIGWVPGRECAVWIPLFEDHGLDIFSNRVVVWAPYIFISYVIGMATGREVWGWPKVIADISMPTSIAGAAPVFESSTLIFTRFAADTQGTNAPLITVRGTDPIDRSAPIWDDGRFAARSIVAAVTGELLELVLDPLGIDPVFPAIAMKQFRDSHAPNLACFQAIVNSPVRFTSFVGGGRHTGQFRAEITTCDSHQIVRDLLGIAPQPGITSLPVEFAAWVEFNFDAIPGSVIARAV
jgi:hypothetical protein